MSYSIGDSVKFVNEDLRGSIIQILPSGKLLVESDDGFEYQVSPSEIVVIGEGNSLIYNVDREEVKKKVKSGATKDNDGFLSKYTATTKFQYERVIEIDLHLEELVEFPMKLDDWQRLHTQMQHVKKCLNAAIERRHRRLVFIHGVGQGVLKTELRNYLSGFDCLTFDDADYREYGYGATEVFIKNS